MITRLVARLSLFVVEFSFESFFTAKGVEVAIPLIKVFGVELLVVVVVVVAVPVGRELLIVNDLRDGS